MFIRLQDPCADLEIQCLLEYSAKLTRASSRLLADIDAKCRNLRHVQEKYQMTTEKSAKLLNDIAENERHLRRSVL
jgi:hypothetical protein